MKLGDVLEKIVGGGTPSKNNDEFWNGNIPWASVKDIDEGQVFLSSTEDTITEEGVNNSSTNIISKGTVIIPTRMGLGRCVINTIDTAINQDLKALYPKKDKLDSKFLLYWLKNNSRLIETMGSGTTVKGIRVEQLTGMNFKEQNLYIQQKIAKILSNYDDLIENNNKRIKILEEMAQKIYKEWFVDFKYPGHETATCKETELGKIVMPKKGKNITKATIKEGNIPVVAGGLEPAYYHNTSNTEAPVITVSASGANAGYVKLYYENIWASDCSYIDNKMTPYVYYFYSYLKHNQVSVTNLQKGAAQPHVYPQDLATLKITDINENVIKKFNLIVAPLFEEIRNIILKNKLLKQTRDMLLPRLMSGEINVDELEIQ